MPVFSSILGGLLALCIVYCMLAPRQFEARARLALRTAPASALNAESTEPRYSGSFASGQTQLETLANVFRSDQLAWRVIVEQKLYQAPAFQGRFAVRYPDFRPDAPAPDARAYLLERFEDRLRVRTVPRTLLLEIRFRCGDAELSSDVVNGLIRAYESEQAESRMLATSQAAGSLLSQMKELKAHSDEGSRRVSDFEKQHGLLMAPETGGNGQSVSTQHLSALTEVDQLGRELVAASAERILREAEYRAASQGDPELVLASDPRLQNETGGLSVTALRQIHLRRSELEQEQVQLAADYGPNYPRVLEIRQQLDDLTRQLKDEDAKLRERFRSAWQTALDREQMLQKSLEERTREGQQMTEAAAQYEGMRREADATQQLYVRMQGKLAEAALSAGAKESDFWVVDPAHAPAKPVSPNLPLSLAITFFVGLWIAFAGAFVMQRRHPLLARVLVGMLVLILTAGASAQAPTPSTSGLPTGVAHFPATKDTKMTPNPKEALPVWNAHEQAAPIEINPVSGVVPGPIEPGDVLDVTEFHIPAFHSNVRVTAGGVVSLPLIGDVSVMGMDEPGAAHAIADALVEKGILRHPNVQVVVTSTVGQDVTVMGEVGRPGVYPFGAHHRLYDLISAASGLTPAAGSVASITHRDEIGTARLIELEPVQSAALERNPELLPGDLVQVSRAGLVYVVGDVNRPGGFTLDPSHSTTVLEALSLAWGPSQNAALKDALLIHARDDGRTVTTLNLKRMLRGLDPDLPVREHDILFVPDSAAKNLWNRTMESVVQSAVGVSIYAGLVYSQRF